ncbi:MAG: ATP-binding protein [Bacteroidales bacterium]|nr:ATP-binding protein [Bacteroidales bacterium]
MLFLSLVFFLSAFFISSSIKRYYAPQNVSKRLTSEIADAFTDLDAEIKNVSSQNNRDKYSFTEFLDKNHHNSLAEKGIEILVYQNDSLKYWTDNVFAAPFIKDSENFTSDVVRSGSGYYLVKQLQVKNDIIIALQLIRYNYKFSNEYLPSGFYKRFSAPDNAAIELTEGEYNINSLAGKFLFSLTYEQPFELALWLQYLIFTLFITSLLCLISAVLLMYKLLISELKLKWLYFVFFVFDVIILRAIQFYFRFPADLYQIQLFNPAYFASSELLPSLGDFLINTLIGVQLSYFAFKYISSQEKRQLKSTLFIKIAAVLLILVLISFYYFLTQTISELVLNSSISFRFENILSLPHISHVGVLIIASLLLGFLILFEIAGKCLINWIRNINLYIYIALTGVPAYAIMTYAAGSFDPVITLLLMALLLILYFQINVNLSGKYRISLVISTVIVLSAMATYIVNKSETIREHEKRRILATHLSDARDNLAEYYFNEASKSIKLDKKLLINLADAKSDSALNEVSDYIKDKYFSGYWSKYLVQITVCQHDKKLSIKPGNIITGCDEYFDGKIDQFMRPVSIPGLFFLRQSIDAMYYLGKIPLKIEDADSDNPHTIFVEISSNDIWKGLGYPELLFDTKNANSDNLSGYSYAFYDKGELVKNVGKFSFDIDNRHIRQTKSEQGFFISNGYSHFVLNIDQNTMIVLSREVPRTSDSVSPFSYLFLLLLVMLLLINWLKGSTLNWSLGIYTFRLRLQVIMISSIVISSIVLVTVSLLFINKLNANKNNEILSEKLNSVLVDLETRYGTFPSFDAVHQEELSDLLLNLSNTYFTDINIYNSAGFLLASSRDQIFREGMISGQINPSGAQQLMVDKKSFFIQRERIGSYSFLSAYTPVRNIDNRLLGYLNLPYFAKQEEIRREISGLISALANIYLLMIVITVMLALLLSRYITRPLQQIGNQFSRVKIGDKNAKIGWTRKDEIGRLVDEYNRMIDEMEKSAELLARSERESAWRLMARQVAHEIKNPLTPIKLSMQLLMKAWNDKAPDWDVRLKRFSQTLIMQIDTLSSIATEFSDFAQMPEPQIQQFDVIPLIQQSVALFHDQSDCKISFDTDQKECIIKADPNQILRVFNNLIKNALQAISDDRQGRIRIKLAVVDNVCEISFQDNGTGIPTDSQTRIFSPNFTTKTAGMGLGLAMVKNIIDNSLGRIWFETVPGKGTTFFVKLPMKDAL